jgi:hypothetical protein
VEQLQIIARPLVVERSCVIAVVRGASQYEKAAIEAVLERLGGVGNRLIRIEANLGGETHASRLGIDDRELLARDATTPSDKSVVARKIWAASSTFP